MPGLADNKSGDSGISGDGGLELNDGSPINNMLKKLGPFLKPWTPQQDLEDDSSSDEEKGKQCNKSATDLVATAQKHVFSLSLPRESQNGSTCDRVEKQLFNSLQKVKPNNFTNNLGSRGLQLPMTSNDNWFLSRSQPNSIEKNPMPSLSDNVRIPRLTFKLYF